MDIVDIASDGGSNNVNTDDTDEQEDGEASACPSPQV